MSNLKLEFLELNHKYSELERKFNQVLELNIELRTIIKTQDKKIQKLESELEKHKVKPNEPPGSKPDYLKETSQKPKTKSGQKKGHKGISRISPTEIHKFVEYEPNCCKHCGSDKIKEIKQRTKVISDLEFQVINSKETYHDMKCSNCNKITKPQSIHGTSKSPYGKTIQTLIGYLRSVCGDTLRPIENLFRDFFKFEISDSSISNNEIRVSKESLDIYNQYLEKVKSSKFSHKDETSYRINGKTNWIWVYDSKDYVFYRMAESRGMKVVNSDFGLNQKQISINDCYGAYNRFENQQICWAHLLREAKFHSEKENVSLNEKIFYEKLKKIYFDAVEFSIGDPPIEVRNDKRTKFEIELTNLMLSLNLKSEFLKRICKRLSNKLTHCFLFVEVEGLPSTNNQAERSIRPFVIHRKASFGSKSWSGAEAKVILKTIYENAKRQGIKLMHALDYLFENQEIIKISTT